MKQREVQDKDNVRWTCVQAFSGSGNQAAEAAAQQVTETNGTVAVVCTPSGGAQTVRLELPLNWIEELSDDDLLSEIENNR